VPVARLLAGAALWVVGVGGVAAGGSFAVESTRGSAHRSEPAVRLAPAPGGSPSTSPAAYDAPPRSAVPVAAPGGSRGASQSSSDHSGSTSAASRPSLAVQPTSARPAALPSPTPSPAATSSAALVAPSPVPSQPGQSDTYAFEGGQVTITCVGDGVTDYVVVAPSWSVDFALSTGSLLDARFTSPGSAVVVKAECRDGVPVFTPS
jgi:hypothetical protein